MRRVPIADDPDTWVIPDDMKERAQQPKAPIEQLAKVTWHMEWMGKSFGSEGYE